MDAEKEQKRHKDQYTPLNNSTKEFRKLLISTIDIQLIWIIHIS